MLTIAHLGGRAAGGGFFLIGPLLFLSRWSASSRARAASAEFVRSSQERFEIDLSVVPPPAVSSSAT